MRCICSLVKYWQDKARSRHSVNLTESKKKVESSQSP